MLCWELVHKVLLRTGQACSELSVINNSQLNAHLSGAQSSKIYQIVLKYQWGEISLEIKTWLLKNGIIAKISLTFKKITLPEIQKTAVLF